jgi:RND family efflux transporter MFP subunit
MSNKYQYQAKPSPSGAHSSISTVADTQGRKPADTQAPSSEALNQSAAEQENGKLPAASTAAPKSEPAVALPLIDPTPIGRPKSSRAAGRQRRSFVFVLGFLIVLLALIFAVWKLNANAAPNVVLYKVSQQQVSMDIGGGGLVFAYQQLDISYPVAERVVNVLVKAGQRVTPNQSLIQLDPSQLNIQIKQASDDVAAAHAYLSSVSAYGTAVSVAAAQQQYTLAVNRYNALLAQASSPLLHNGNLISPMNGVVTTVNVNPGEVFAANMPLLTIMDESTVVVRVKVPLSNLSQVHVGQAARVTPSATPNVTMNGTVSSIIPQADPQTDTFEVWVSVVNREATLLPGMSAFARIQTPVQALTVPGMAVLNLDTAPTVFVVRDSRAHLQAVHVVGRSVDTIFISGGLAAGDQLVLAGIENVQDGQLVHITRVEG